ncbi:MAG: D-methionine ABC transporter permease MetI [Gammaproteobacteria bacterium]|nr:MAG: D-methionine ABC transporter permease MetI [Gammaproteobacteria bacterium]
MHSELIALFKATWETIYIVFLSSVISVTIGSCIGTLLFLTREKQAFENKWFNQSIGFIVNATRSIPFIILMISILPLTRCIMGTTIGTNAAIVPLSLAAIPFFARICESAFAEIPYALIETAHALGVSTWQLISKILIPESLPSLIRGITLTIIGLIGYSAMAGAIGGGGLGELAINYGYQRFNVAVTLETVVVLIVIVQSIQLAGDILAKKRQFKPILLASLFLGIACIGSQLYPLFNVQENTLKIGVSSGWSEEVMKVAQQVALEQYHLHLEIVPFNDYVLPNTALANGNIDANIFQHIPYLDAQVKSHGYPLVPIAKTFVYPMGFYSRKLSHLSALKTGDIIALPNDPSNEARSLLLLQKAGLITLNPRIGTLATINDIVENPKHLQFKLLDAAQLPRVLQDAALVAITNDYVGPAGLDIHQALLKEGPDSLYANVIVVRKADQHNPAFQQLTAVMHSRSVVEETKKIFPNGAAIAAF